MLLTKHRRDEHPPQRRDVPPPAAYLSRREDRDRVLLFDDVDFDGPAEMPDGWQPARGADQLDHDAVRTTIDELIADTRPVPPTALRQAHDRNTWLPVTAGLRQVRMDIAARQLPGRDTLAYLTAVSVAIQADHETHMNTLRVIDAIRAAAPDTHTLAMAIAPISEQLAVTL